MTNIERTAYLNLLNKAVDGNDLDRLSDQIAVSEFISVTENEQGDMPSEAFIPSHLM